MVKAYVMITSDTAHTEQVVERVRELDSVIEVHEVLGPYDVVAEVEAPDLEDILKLLRHQIRIILGVRNTVTCIAIE